MRGVGRPKLVVRCWKPATRHQYPKNSNYPALFIPEHSERCECAMGIGLQSRNRTKWAHASKPQLGVFIFPIL